MLYYCGGCVYSGKITGYRKFDKKTVAVIWCEFRKIHMPVTDYCESFRSPSGYEYPSVFNDWKGGKRKKEFEE